MSMYVKSNSCGSASSCGKTKDYVQSDEIDDIYEDFEYNSHEQEIQEAVKQMPRRFYWEDLTELGYMLYVDFYEALINQEPDTEPYILYKEDTDYKSGVFDIAFPFYDEYIVFAMNCKGELATIIWWDEQSASSIEGNNDWENVDDIIYDEEY